MDNAGETWHCLRARLHEQASPRPSSSGPRPAWWPRPSTVQRWRTGGWTRGRSRSSSSGARSRAARTQVDPRPHLLVRLQRTRSSRHVLRTPVLRPRGCAAVNAWAARGDAASASGASVKTAERRLLLGPVRGTGCRRRAASSRTPSGGNKQWWQQQRWRQQRARAGPDLPARLHRQAQGLRHPLLASRRASGPTAAGYRST